MLDILKIAKLQNVAVFYKIDIFLYHRFLDRPSVTADITMMNGTLGENKNLTCHVWSSPAPTLLTWYFDDAILPSSSRYL